MIDAVYAQISRNERSDNVDITWGKYYTHVHARMIIWRYVHILYFNIINIIKSYIIYTHIATWILMCDGMGKISLRVTRSAGASCANVAIIDKKNGVTWKIPLGAAAGSRVSQNFWNALWAPDANRVTKSYAKLPSVTAPRKAQPAQLNLTERDGVLVVSRNASDGTRIDGWVLTCKKKLTHWNTIANNRYNLLSY